MEKNSIAIVHFNPIELYPPILNILNYMAENMGHLKVDVFTCRTNKTIQEYGNKKNVTIHRYALLDQTLSMPKRYYNYIAYYIKTYRSLKKMHPAWVWYFETISALPAAWYFRDKRFQDSKLLIHYHEYVAPEEYASGPWMIRWIHQREKRLYPITEILSQTNKKRMELFLRDEQPSLNGRTYILPNYPPLSWAHAKAKNNLVSHPIKIVHAGSIGMDSLYIKEFCHWVHEQQGRVLFDIYSNQDMGALQNYLTGKGYEFISIKGHIAYEALPTVLSTYDVGVILYKGVIPNHVFAVSNKLFEYWACGLDVWFSDKMVSSLAFARDQSLPKLLPLDFEKLDQLDLAATINQDGLGYQPSPYYCEPLFDNFFEQCGMKGNKGISREDAKELIS